MDVFAQLEEFRQAAYQCLCRAKDATFELMDSVLNGTKKSGKL